MNSAVDAAGLSRWSLSEPEKKTAIAVLLLALVARWQALSLGYTSDDLFLIVPAGPDGDLRWNMLSQGRLLSYMLCLALSKLGAYPPHAAVAGQVLMHLALVWCGLMLSRLWRLGSRPFESFLVVALLTLHPYMAETVAFRFTPLFFALAIFLATWALVSCTDSRRNAILSCLALLAALMIYQVVINFLAMALLLTAVFYCYDGQAREMIGRASRRRYLLVLGACAAYFAASAILPAQSNITLLPKSRFIGIGEVPARILLLLTHWRALFFEGEPILPVASKAILWLAIGLGLAGLIAKARRTAWASGPRSEIQAWVLALALGLPLCTGVIAVLQEFWPAPRVLAHSGMLWGVLLVLAWRNVPALLRKPWFACAGLVLFSFVGLNNLIFNDQLRLNLRDFANANRILGRIEEVPGAASLRYLVVDGGRWGYPAGLASVQTGLNVSALYTNWSKVSLFNELSGSAFFEAPNEIKEEGHQACGSLPKWPAAGSVTRLERAVLVCLGP